MSFGKSTSVRHCNKEKLTDGPDPGSYAVNATAKGRLNTSLHAAASHHKSGGGTFGLSSSQRPCVQVKYSDSPGPGEYETKHDSKGRLDTQHKAKFSHNQGTHGFGSPTAQRHCNKTAWEDGPAPGDYEVTMDAKGRLDTQHAANKSHHAVGGGTFGLSSSVRHVNKEQVISDGPAPGDYDAKMDAKGRLNVEHKANFSHHSQHGGTFGLSSSVRLRSTTPC